MSESTWIKAGLDFFCLKCHKFALYDDGFYLPPPDSGLSIKAARTPFCPWCGAEMRNPAKFLDTEKQ